MGNIKKPERERKVPAKYKRTTFIYKELEKKEEEPNKNIILKIALAHIMSIVARGRAINYDNHE
jgi:hypothetical protein